MLLAQHQVERSAPAPIVFAELAVLEPLGAPLLVLDPQQLERDPGASARLHLTLHVAPVRQRAGNVRGLGRRIEPRLQLHLRPAGRQRPRDARRASARQVLVHRAAPDRQAAGDGAVSLTYGLQPQDLPGLTHGQPFRRHLASGLKSPGQETAARGDQVIQRRSRSSGGWPDCAVMTCRHDRNRWPPLLRNQRPPSAGIRTRARPCDPEATSRCAPVGEGASRRMAQRSAPCPGTRTSSGAFAPALQRRESRTRPPALTSFEADPPPYQTVTRTWPA